MQARATRVLADRWYCVTGLEDFERPLHNRRSNLILLYCLRPYLIFSLPGILFCININPMCWSTGRSGAKGTHAYHNLKRKSCGEYLSVEMNLCS